MTEPRHIWMLSGVLRGLLFISNQIVQLSFDSSVYGRNEEAIRCDRIFGWVFCIKSNCFPSNKKSIDFYYFFSIFL